MLKAASFIEKLNLQPHIEGGYYKEVYRHIDTIDSHPLQAEETDQRHLCTSIYFLLEAGQVSKFHSLKSDELWYYHYGAPMLVHCLNQNGSYDCHRLGPDLHCNEIPFLRIPAGVIFGSEPDSKDSFSLVSCVVSPGFDFKDFKLFTKAELLAAFPEHKDIIVKLT